MSDFDSADCLERYLALVRERPDRFTNPDGDIYEILLDTPRIDRARRDAERRRRDERLPSDDTRVGVLAVDPYLLVLRDAVRFADGSYGLYNRLLVPAGAAILPVLGDSIALLHRFRHGTRAMASRSAARRVLGRRHVQRRGAARAGRGNRIAGRPSSSILDSCIRRPAASTRNISCFSRESTSVGTADQHEAIESIKVLPSRHVERLIAEGEITDGPTLALFLRARLRGYRHLSSASMCLSSGARSMKRWLPTMPTASEPTALPMNPITSIGAPSGRANRPDREHRIAGADAIDRSQREAGRFEEPLVTAVTERPLRAARDEHLPAAQLLGDAPHDVAQVAGWFAGFEPDLLLREAR